MKSSASELGLQLFPFAEIKQKNIYTRVYTFFEAWQKRFLYFGVVMGDLGWISYFLNFHWGDYFFDKIISLWRDPKKKKWRNLGLSLKLSIYSQLYISNLLYARSMKTFFIYSYKTVFVVVGITVTLILICNYSLVHYFVAI